MKFLAQLITIHFRLQAAAENKLANFKELSATGIQYAVEKRVVMDVNIDISAPYIIVPYGGLLTRYVHFGGIISPLLK